MLATDLNVDQSTISTMQVIWKKTKKYRYGPTIIHKITEDQSYDQEDEELVESIRFPAQDPNAAEVFYRVIKKNGNGPPVFVDDLLQTVKVPLLLLWGDKDPWIRPAAADKIQALFPAAKRVDVDGGHCPHDEASEACNQAIKDFLLSA